MICDAHVHVGDLGDDRTAREFKPAEIAAVLKRHGVDEFIFSSMNAQKGLPFDVIERDAVETKAAFGAGAHAFYWLAGRFYDADPDLKALDSGIACAYEKQAVKKLSDLTDSIMAAADALEDSLKALADAKDIIDESAAIRDNVLVKMGELRVFCDEAETLTAKDLWPFPNYADLLFSVK